MVSLDERGKPDLLSSIKGINIYRAIMPGFRNHQSNQTSLTTQILTGATVAGVVGLLASALLFSIEGLEEIESSNCSSCTTTITGTDNGSYNLSNGDVFCIASGATFSGSVQRNSGNGTVIICNEGTISGASLTFNKGDNYVNNYGTMTSSSLTFNNSNKTNEFNNYDEASASFSTVNFYSSGTSVHNYGEMSAGAFTLSNGAEFTNYATGSATMGNLTLNSQTDSDNQGGMTVNGNVAINSNAEMGNTHNLTITGNLTVNNEFSSDGTLVVGGNMSINGSGEAELDGSASIGGNLTANKKLEQDGSLTIGGNFTVNGGGAVTVLGNITVDGNFTVNSHVEGHDPSSSEYGTIYILGQTTLNGGGDLSGKLDVCDAGEPEDGIDNFYGNADPTVTWCDNAAVSMPVEWLAFDAAFGSEGVDLMWMTAIEENNDFFTVERSADAMQFEEIERIQGAGNSTGPMTYEARDAAPPAGRVYYRIRQTDFDGKMSYSDRVEVMVDVGMASSLRVFPNPATDMANITVEIREAGRATLVLMNMNGQIIRSQPMNLHVGRNQTTMQVDQLPAGQYIIQVRQNNGTKPVSGRLVKR